MFKNMATDFASGSVPPFYREVYDIVCPNQEHVDHDMFLKLLVKSSLPKSTLSQIWEAVDNKQGYLTRTGLYKAMALCALAQQGKNVNEKVLDSYADQELPKPSLGDLSDLKNLSLKLRREKNPNLLGYTYQELCELDTIKLELVPEKKGIILKHSEYEITSRRYKTTVKRRYNDFIAFQEMLLTRFPYRMIPRLPPKKAMGVSKEFIEHRRRSLRRFLNQLVRHPSMYDDSIVTYFLTFAGSDMQSKIKEHFKGVPDEFMTNDNALKAKDLVPLDTQTQFGYSKTLITKLTGSVCKLREISERMVLRNASYASDMMLMGRELGSLSTDTTPCTIWGSGNCTTWSDLKTGFKPVAGHFASLAEKSSSHASSQEEGIVEELLCLQDMLFSYKDLCERQEKNVVNDHQKAIHKMGQYKKKKMSATIGTSGADSVDQLEHRILQQENEISNMENRNYFSLHCMQMETQLIHCNLETLYIALHIMSNEQGNSHTEVAYIWNQIKPAIDCLLPKDINKNTSLRSSFNPVNVNSTSNSNPSSPLYSPTKERDGPGLIG